MANFLKVILFLIVVAGIAIYFLAYHSEIFQSIPRENIFSPTPKYVAPSSAPTSISPAPTSQKSTISSQEPTIPNYLIPKDFTREQLSPYFNKVKISSVNTWNYPIQIRLYSYLSNNEKVNITGWRIKSNNGQLIIPQAVNIYESSGLSPMTDIILSGSNSIVIYNNQNSLGKNLRLNKCLGYLQENYFFNPSLPQNCPSISHSEISYLSGKCQNYIQSLWGCKTPEKSFYDFLATIGDDLICRNFLDTINYQGCFEKHHLDSDFLSNEWWLWLNWGAQPILDKQHDRLLLFDKQGLLVDEYTY